MDHRVIVVVGKGRRQVVDQPLGISEHAGIDGRLVAEPLDRHQRRHQRAQEIDGEEMRGSLEIRNIAGCRGAVELDHDRRHLGDRASTLLGGHEWPRAGEGPAGAASDDQVVAPQLAPVGLDPRRPIAVREVLTPPSLSAQALIGLPVDPHHVVAAQHDLVAGARRGLDRRVARKTCELQGVAGSGRGERRVGRVHGYRGWCPYSIGPIPPDIDLARRLPSEMSRSAQVRAGERQRRPERASGFRPPDPVGRSGGARRWPRPARWSATRR